MNLFTKRETSTLVLIALSTLMLGACSDSTKPPRDTVSTYETDEYGRSVKVTTTREVQPSPPPVKPLHEDKSAHVRIDGDGLEGDGIEANIDENSGSVRVNVPQYNENGERAHVRAPMVKVDADDQTGQVHIKAPFVNITKNGHGDRTTIRIPGITIRGSGE